ncbi:xanthine dehydrogenase family protein molybdopterin-binding subunit [Acuticoccus kandeliae]|uniref:xanthine dehydrogenase family protein molybdopterin-binding subunit n=1 Tax=Acuticoccus kandeliae TaxID=2073160 RepID=UPI001472A54C|nr:molybdopterin cofactor-binding domain-containing protein [Acuticoccus kandeliae]
MKRPSPLDGAPLIRDWIGFSSGRVEVYSGRVELGQGNLTALAQIAAEELDVDLAFVNITGADTTRTPNEGVTAGSLSIAIGGMALRKAASAARHVLLAEAARLLQSAPDGLTIENGVVLRDGEDVGLTLWRVADTADLAVPVADHAAPKPPEARRLAGTSAARIDLEARVFGHPFVHDLAPEGLLYGKAIHPPTMTARLGPFDLDALRARPGVVDAVLDGSFLGLVAESETEALAAARWAANRAQWSDAGEAPDDPVAAVAGSQEPLVMVHELGDVTEAMGTAYEATVSRPYLSHGSIGPSAALAQWRDGRLEVHTHSQGVYPLRGALALVFGMDAAAIDVIHTPGSGCYGHNGADDVALDAALIARIVPGRPVLVVWSRADEFARAPLAPAMVTRARAIVSDSGAFSAFEVVVNSPPHGNRPGRATSPNLRAAAYLATPFPPDRSADLPVTAGGGADRNATPLYSAASLSIAKRIVHDLPYRTSSMRALGATINILAIETLMDEIAEERGEDSVAFRLTHLEDPRARAVIEAVVADAGDPLDTEGGEGAGWGLGFARYKNIAAYCAILARIEVDEEVRVTDVFAVVDTGEIINPDGVINQIEGGIIQAISWSLKEAVRFDGRRVATETWLDYPILRFTEVPNIAVRLLSRPDAPPLGCAEAAQGPMTAAIGNALSRAIGVRVTALPFTRDRVIEAMMQAAASEETIES